MPPAHKFRWGGTRPSLRKLALPMILSLLFLAGCGAGGGVEAGATVNVYVAAPLCAEAEEVLARDGGEVGDLRVRVRCLPKVENDGQLDLAQIGANARRAVEDSSTAGYIGEASPRATRFSRPILESAEVPQLPTTNGAAAMSQLLEAIEQAGDTSGSLRESVNESLE